jgi:hypothetical protein
MGEIVLLMGEIVLLMGEIVLLMGEVALLMGEVVLLMGEVVFPTEKSPGTFAGWQVLRQKPSKTAFSPPERG